MRSDRSAINAGAAALFPGKVQWCCIGLPLRQRYDTVGYLEDLVRTADEHPEFGHVLCGFKCTSHEHDYILTGREPMSVVDRKDYMRLYDAILIQGPCLGLYRAEIVRRNHLKMREDMSLAEDTIFNLDYLDALDCTSIGVINKTNYIYQDEDQQSLYHRYRPDLLEIEQSVLERIRQSLKQWGVTEEASWNRYYNAVFHTYIRVLENTFHEQSSMSTAEKIAFNDQILRSDGFRKIINNKAIVLPSSLRRAYQSGDYRKALALKRLQRAKYAVSRFLRSVR